MVWLLKTWQEDRIFSAGEDISDCNYVYKPTKSTTILLKIGKVLPAQKKTPNANQKTWIFYDFDWIN